MPPLQLRAALATAESAASKLCGDAEPDVRTQAQALLHRLAAIRAELDLLEQLASPPLPDSLKRPAATHPHRRIRS